MKLTSMVCIEICKTRFYSWYVSIIKVVVTSTYMYFIEFLNPHVFKQDIQNVLHRRDRNNSLKYSGGRGIIYFCRGTMVSQWLSVYRVLFSNVLTFFVPDPSSTIPVSMAMLGLSCIKLASNFVCTVRATINANPYFHA